MCSIAAAMSLATAPHLAHVHLTGWGSRTGGHSARATAAQLGSTNDQNGIPWEPLRVFER